MIGCFIHAKPEAHCKQCFRYLISAIDRFERELADHDRELARREDVEGLSIAVEALRRDVNELRARGAMRPAQIGEELRK